MAHPLTHLTHGIPTRRPFHPAKTAKPFRDEKGAAAKAKNSTRRKRQILVGAVAAAGIAAEHRGLERHLICGLDQNANARGRQRVGWSAGGKIGGEKGGPTDAIVDEVRGGLALQKLAVRRHQTKAHGKAAIEGALLIPKRIKPRDRPGFEIRDRQNIAEVRLTEERAMGNETMGVKMAALPAQELCKSMSSCG
jgi:hypothetical protein